MSMGITAAFADGDTTATTYKITINNNDQTGAHTYSAYQILTGDLDTDATSSTKGQLKNLNWGLTVEQANLLIDALKADATIGSRFTAVPTVTAANSAQSAVQFAAALDGVANDSAVAQAFAAVVGKFVNDNSVTASGSSTETASPYTIAGLAQGYYFVQDTGTIAEGDSSTRYIVSVVGDTTVAAKSSTVSVDKKVDDKDDSTTDEDSITWQDSADYDIGDTIPFKVTGTLPSNFDDYSTYSYKFTDTMTNLTYVDGSAHVYIYGYEANAWRNSSVKEYGWVDVSKYFTINYSGNTLTVEATGGLKTEKTNYAPNADYYLGEGITTAAFDTTPVDDLETEGMDRGWGLDSTSKIVVRYDATLDSSAAMGSTGNSNEVKITYSNNPNGDGTGNTPGDKVTVFSFNLDVDKVDENGNALSGAGFTLYKYNASSTADDKYEAVGSEVTGVTSFVWSGLDAGKYKLVETTVPAGYNKADDITFDVVAKHSTSSATPTLESLSVTNVQPSSMSMSASTSASGTTSTYTQATEYVAGTTYYTKSSDGYTVATVADAEAFAAGTYYTKIDTQIKANLQTTVVNNSGTVLPSTGGIGTTIFYVVGSIMVVAAGVLLITKKRMSREG